MIEHPRKNGETKWPRKRYRAKIAFGPYAKGAILEPVGAYREVLLSKGVIEPIPEEPPAIIDRVIDTVETFTRGRRAR